MDSQYLAYPNALIVTTTGGVLLTFPCGAIANTIDRLLGGPTEKTS